MTWSIGIVLRVHCVCVGGRVTWSIGIVLRVHCVCWWEGDMEYRDCAPGSLCVLVGG